MRSSYEQNNYGSVFQTLVSFFEPRSIIEFGVLDGYSTYHIANAVKSNKEEKNIFCDFYAYDLWDEYNYKHGNFKEVKNMLISKGLYDYVNLNYGDIFKIYKKIPENSVDLLFIDISNDGDKIKKAIELWNDKIKKSIIIEGGSIDRDNIEWMKKYNKKPIRPVLEEDIFVNENYNWVVFDPFPSITLLMKK